MFSSTSTVPYGQGYAIMGTERTYILKWQMCNREKSAMKIKCNFCGNWIDENQSTCPNCGATNERYKRVGNGVPTTIEELKNWAQAHNLPLNDMRTYIGEDYKGARAFGIYYDQNTGNYVVYKNKDDGSRAIRYEGPDEAYAVNELYLKMKERVATQKAHQVTRKASGKSNTSTAHKCKKILGFIPSQIGITATVLIVGGLLAIVIAGSGPSTGYYYYDGTPYYYQEADSSWYEYDSYADEWEYTTPSSTLVDNADDYYDSGSYSYDAEYSDFSDSEYYTEYDDSDWSSDSDWDSDSSWDSGSDWDSGYDDWGSDW